MLSESHPSIRRFLRFIALPYCYFKLVNWTECTAPWYQVVRDLLYIFFRLKYFPDNYSPCRFWEKDRAFWSLYYGSTYHPYARQRLRKEVQPYEHEIVFQDKAVCEVLCRGINIRMPAYFGIIEPDRGFRNKIEYVFLNTNLKKLIIKPIMGQAGRGVELAVKRDDKIIIKSKDTEVSLGNYVLSGKAIVQEFISQHEIVAKISSSSVNTVRIVTLYTKSQESIIVSTMMRFGINDSYIDNWSAGGIAVGVDQNTGKLMKTAYDKYGHQYIKHPVSKVVFRNYPLPWWNEVIRMAIKIQKECPFYRLSGMDIAISKEGPVLIEVNAGPDIIMQEQTAGPLLENEKTYKEFAKYNLLINRFQKNLYR